MYDMAIVGGGPGAWSAAITGKMRNLKVCVLMAADGDSWLHRAERIENYPGMPMVSGKEMLKVFEQQAKELQAEIIKGTVRQIMPMGDTFMLLCGNEVIDAKTVVLAMGAARPKTLPGEAQLVGQGISYCGTCDGMFYREKDVIVLSSGSQGIEEANFLAGLAQKVDYFSLKRHKTEELNSSVIVHNQRPFSIEKQEDKIKLHTKEGQSFLGDGLFVFRPAVALDQLIPGLETKGAFIDVNRKMETNLPGVYAAGDCTGQPLQIGKAVGEGNIAAISAAEFIQKKNRG